MQTSDVLTTDSHTRQSARPQHEVVARGMNFLPIVLALLACGSAITGPFLSWDDALYVTANPRVQESSWAGFVTLWNPEDALAGRFIEYFPLRDSLYWALWALFGANSAAFHMSVILLHAVATWRVGALARALFPGSSGVVAAALFAVLPVHVESVAWISALKDPLYTALLIAAVETHVAFRRTGRTRHLVASLVAVALGFLVKSLIVVVPGVLLLVDWLLSVPPRQIVMALVPHALVCALFLVPILEIAASNDVIASYPGGSLTAGMMTTVVSYGIYLSTLFWPVGLNAWYVVAPVLTPADPRFIFAALVLGIVAIAAGARAGRGDRIHLFALAWWAGSLVPVVNFVPHRIEVADRYQYAPSIAFCFWGALMLERVRLPRVRQIARLATLANFFVLSGLQALSWVDEEQLWRQVLEQPDAATRAQPLVALGNVLEQRGRVGEALESYLLATHASDALARPFAHAALVLARMGRVAEADALALEAITRNRASEDAWRAMAAVAEARGDWSGVASSNARLSMIAPDDAVRTWNHAVSLWRIEAEHIAARRFDEAVRRKPDLCPRLQAFTDAQARSEPERAAHLRRVHASSCIATPTSSG